MKTRLILLSAMAFVMLCFNGCTPDEVETTQDQFKPLVITVTLASPIVQSNYDLNYSEDILSVTGILGGAGFLQEINGEFPNQVGLSNIQLDRTAVSNTSLLLGISYLHLIDLDTYQCNTVSVEVIFNGQTIFYESRELGSDDGSCGDGSEWDINITLP